MLEVYLFCIQNYFSKSSENTKAHTGRKEKPQKHFNIKVVVKSYSKVWQTPPKTPCMFISLKMQEVFSKTRFHKPLERIEPYEKFRKLNNNYVIMLNCLFFSILFT